MYTVVIKNIQKEQGNVKNNINRAGFHNESIANSFILYSVLKLVKQFSIL